ncbi:hypothetical protein R3P38DRAFT_3225207 [Favolaschia claudopus]|uniref:Uncharacterized protein n=1 Tax=Favolaschia claudopus TaxID=2862362 RepID=A0AAV9ZUC9_9AGAR
MSCFALLLDGLQGITRRVQRGLGTWRHNTRTQKRALLDEDNRIPSSTTQPCAYALHNEQVLYAPDQDHACNASSLQYGLLRLEPHRLTIPFHRVQDLSSASAILSENCRRSAPTLAIYSAKSLRALDISVDTSASHASCDDTPCSSSRHPRHLSLYHRQVATRLPPAEAAFFDALGHLELDIVDFDDMENVVHMILPELARLLFFLRVHGPACLGNSTLARSCCRRRSVGVVSRASNVWKDTSTCSAFACRTGTLSTNTNA